MIYVLSSLRPEVTAKINKKKIKQCVCIINEYKDAIITK